MPHYEHENLISKTRGLHTTLKLLKVEYKQQ